MRVLALMKYGARAASTRQRLLQYQPYLETRGIEIAMSPLLDDAHVARIGRGRRSSPFAISSAYFRRLAMLLRARRFDVIWLHCELLPYMPGWVERLVRLAGRPVVLDYDDAIFHMYDAHRSGLVRRTIGLKFASVVRSADAVMAGNAYLADYAMRFSDAVTIVPTVVDTDAYLPRPESREARPVVGWIGSPSTWRYVAAMLPTILPVIARHGAVFRAVGGGRESEGVAGVEAVEWREDREIAEVQAMDVGIMPLDDQPWAKGKCGYKLIQYMACGSAVIASPVGVNVEIVADGVEGLIAGTAAQWAAALDRLLGDAALRRAMGERGRAKVVSAYSLASQAPRVAAVLARVAGEGHG